MRRIEHVAVGGSDEDARRIREAMKRPGGKLRFRGKNDKLLTDDRV